MITIGIMMTIISNITFMLRQFIAIDLGGLSLQYLDRYTKVSLFLNAFSPIFKDSLFKHLLVSALDFYKISPD